MRLLTFCHEDAAEARVGALLDERIVDLAAVSESEPGWAGDMSSLLALPDEELVRLAEIVGRRGLPTLALEDCRLLAPLVPPTIVCVGLNYRPLAEAMSYEPAAGPPIFLKAPSTVVGPGEAIVLPAVDTGPVACEVELGVVIGNVARNVPAAAAFDVIAGYTIVLDVTANAMMERDSYAFRRPDEPRQTHVVFFRAKNFDTFSPIGPTLVTRDEIPDRATASLEIEAWVDGEQFVRGNTRDMLVGIPEIIEYVTSVMTLEPGDLIATGHPGHVVPRSLAAGETIEARVGTLGTLTVSVENEEVPTTSGAVDGSETRKAAP